MKPRDARWVALACGVAAMAGCSTLLGIDAEYGSEDDGGTTSAPGSGTTSTGQGGSKGTGTGSAGSADTTGAGGSQAVVSGSGGAPDAGRDATIADGSTGSGGSADGGATGGKGGTGGSGGGAGSGGSAGSGGGGKGGAGGGDAGRILSPIARVQRGSANIAAGSSLQRVTVQQLDPTHAFLVFGTRFDGNAPGLTQVSGQITGPTELTFTRQTPDGGPTVPISYYVAEFQSGVLVQRGATTLSSMSMTASLTPIDLTKSFPIVTYRNTGASYGKDDFVRAKLTSSSQLTLENMLAAPSGIVEWQVVTFDGASVQSGDVNVAAGDTMVTAPVQTVDPAKTWLLFSYDFGTTMTSVADLMLRGRVESATQLAFRRTISGASGTLSWYAVSFDNGTVLQRGTSAVVDTATMLSVPLNAIDPLTTILAASGLYQRGGSTGMAATGTPGHATFTLDLNSSTQLLVGRGASAAGAAATVDWSAVAFR
jgi:hypothetical protein